MLFPRVSLGDVRDIEAFVHASLAVAPWTRRMVSGERAELVCEGLAIMCELHARFDGRGCFSGYAARYLPGRLEDAWHRLHRGEHVQRRGPVRWTFEPPAASLDQLLATPGFSETRTRPQPIPGFHRSRAPA